MISFEGIDVDNSDIDMDGDHTDYVDMGDGTQQLVTMSRSHWWMLEYIIKEMGHPLAQILQEIEEWNSDGADFETCLRVYVEGYTENLQKLLEQPADESPLFKKEGSVKN